MLAVDTNIVVRYLTGDHPEQFAKARALIDGEDIFVCTTVLLETGWVLGRAYRFSPDRIIAALTAFAGLPRVTLEDPGLAANALDWTARGMGFAEAPISQRPRAAKRSSALTNIWLRWPIPLAR